MDIKQLLEKMQEFAGEKVGQKPGDQWRGTDSAPPGKKLVGDSIIKDLSKGLTPKTKEQELAEEWAVFSEENIGTHPKRPARKNARHARGHEPQPRYKTVKTDEGKMKDIYTSMMHHADKKGYSSHKQFTPADYDELAKPHGISGKELAVALGHKKASQVDEAGNPAQQAAIAIAMKKAGKTPKNESLDQEYTVVIDRNGRERSTSGTIAELLDYFGYTLEVGKSYEHERGRYKINMTPRTIQQLVDNLNKAASNGAANGAASTYYSVGQSQVAEGVPYKATNPHPALQDPIVAKVVKQMRPGLKNLDMNNEAFLYFAYEIGKMRAREMWEDYGPAIKYFYQSGIGVNEGWESGPEEYEEPYDDADDAYDRQRQEKIDTEAEKEWAKLPKVSTYKLVGRGPNMEPNYEFGDEFDTLEQAVEYRAEIMKDPKTPHPEHIGIRTLTRVKDQTNEAVQGGGGVKDINDYVAKRDYIYQQLADPKQVDNYPHFKQALFDLMRTARQQGIKIEESKAHKELATWWQNREIAQNFATGKSKIPTPQERNVKIEKPKKQVKEYGANNPLQGTTIATSATSQKVDPKQAQQVAQNINVQKTALGQLKQLNPDINPQKAAMAATKDLATMNPQEKEVLAQVAKTLSPALGSPAFGSIKTALQKTKTS